MDMSQVGAGRHKDYIHVASKRRTMNDARLLSLRLSNSQRTHSRDCWSQSGHPRGSTQILCRGNRKRRGPKDDVTSLFASSAKFNFNFSIAQIKFTSTIDAMNQEKS